MAVQLPSPNGFLHLISPISSQLHKKRFPGTFAIQRLMVGCVKGKNHNPPARLRRPPEPGRGSPRCPRLQRGAAPSPEREVPQATSDSAQIAAAPHAAGIQLRARRDRRTNGWMSRSGSPESAPRAGSALRAFPRRPAGRRPRSAGKGGGDGVGPPAARPPLPSLCAPPARLGRGPPSPRDGVRQKRGDPDPAPSPLPPCAHLEVLLEANGQYLGHGWGRAPRGRGAGQGRTVKGRPPVLPSRRRERRRRGALAGMARPPPSSASARGRSLAGITPHLTSLPGSPQIVPPCRASSSAHRRRLLPALTLPPSSAPLSLTPAEGAGWGRGSEEPGGPRRGCGQRRGAGGVVRVRVSFRCCHTRSRHPAPCPAPPGAAPARPTPGAPPDPPEPRGWPLTRPTPGAGP